MTVPFLSRSSFCAQAQTPRVQPGLDPVSTASQLEVAPQDVLTPDAVAALTDVQAATDSVIEKSQSRTEKVCFLSSITSISIMTCYLSPDHVGPCQVHSQCLKIAESTNLCQKPDNRRYSRPLLLPRRPCKRCREPMRGNRFEISTW